MKREIKYRAWDTKYQIMIESVAVGIEADQIGLPYDEDDCPYTLDQIEESEGGHLGSGDDWIFILNQFEIMQFTGHQINTVDLYEGDIIRQEIAGTEGDEHLYLVVVWISEWGMFGGLNIGDGEYEEYLEGGADKLDEASFWTFPIEVKSEFATISICGNLFEHPHLLNKQ